VVRLSRDQAAAAIAQADATSGIRPHTALHANKATTPHITELREMAFNRIKALRPALEEFVADARAPVSVDAATYRQTLARIALGAASVGDMVAEAEGFIGCDFGTSTTKTIIRWPYEAGSGHAIALPVPDGWQSGGVPHLWPTAVYFDRDHQRFSPLPRDGFRQVLGFKSALLQGNGHRMCAGGAMTNAEATVAFLAQYLAYTLGTLRELHSRRQVSTVNFGIPVAKMMANATAQEFVRVIKAAMSLIGRADQLALADVWEALANPVEGPLQATFHAELSGAIAGYVSGARHRRGSHMIIDCGSATLDIASFALGDDEWPIGIYAAQVEALGADACARYLAEGVSEVDCRRAARVQEGEVFKRTLLHARAGFQLQDGGKFAYQVILVGGGIDSDVHQPLLEKMEDAFSFKFHRPTFDTPVDREKQSDDARLILANGLARDPIDLRKVLMPYDNPPPVHEGQEMVTKDKV
jgi:hypothetical protein